MKAIMTVLAADRVGIIANVCSLLSARQVNVLDISRHCKNKTAELSGTANPFTITGPLILSTLVVKSGANTLVLDKDYSVEQSGLTTTLTVLKQTNIVNDTINLTYKEVDAAQVTKADIIGGIDANDNEMGIDVIEKVYPRLGLIPGTLIVPKWSQDSEVAQIMASKVVGINGCFKSAAVCDIPTSTIKKYSDCYNHKSRNNLVDENLFVCWPKVALGERQYYLSTHLAALMALVDNENNDGIPFESPSNNGLKMDKACLADGTQVDLSKLKANTLNGYGIVTSLNFAGMWRLFGNRTSIYPTSPDPKDAWIPCRRMFSWIGNTLVTTFFYKIDRPINKRLVQSIVDSAQIWLNGLVARGALLGGKIQFREVDNTITELADGIIRFYLSLCPPTPARVINFKLEFDTKYFEELFS